MVKRAMVKRAGRTGRKVGLRPSPPGAWPLDLNLLEINLSALPRDPHPPPLTLLAVRQTRPTMNNR